MQGTEETDLASQRSELDCYKNIIRFPIGLSKDKFNRLDKKNNNKRVTTELINIASTAKKINCFLLNIFEKKENLIFLITLKRNNFKGKFSQKFLCRWDMDVFRSIREHWASNSPRYLK